MSTTPLENKVLCVNLRKTCLGTSFVDGYLTETLEVQTGARNRKVKGSKKILGDGLKAIQTIQRRLGEYVKEQTLPGISADLRIVTPKVLEDIRNEVDKAEVAIAEEVAKLSEPVTWTHPDTGEIFDLTRWAALIRQDEIDLDKAFDPTDYPPIENLEGFFTVRLTVCDLPKGDYFRVEGLTEEAVAKLKEDHAKTLEAVKAAGKNEVHRKLTELIGRIADNLGREDISKLHDTTFTNLQEYLAKVPDLNISGDPQLEALRLEAEAALNYTMAQVKASAVLKEQAAEAAKDILNRFGRGTRRLNLTAAPTPAAIEPSPAASESNDVAA
jgi:hypothetical protein